MRPSDITDGISARVCCIPCRNPKGFNEAVDITDGILVDADRTTVARHEASMRPSDITDGIAPDAQWQARSSCTRFNEAVGYYRRNLPTHEGVIDMLLTAVLQ